MREFGWVEGQNLHAERLYANGHFEALQPLAEELVRAKVDVIVIGLLRGDLANPDVAYTRWTKRLRAEGGRSHKVLRIDWNLGEERELR